MAGENEAKVYNEDGGTKLRSTIRLGKTKQRSTIGLGKTKLRSKIGLGERSTGLQ